MPQLKSSSLYLFKPQTFFDEGTKCLSRLSQFEMGQCLVHYLDNQNEFFGQKIVENFNLRIFGF